MNPFNIKPLIKIKSYPKLLFLYCLILSSSISSTASYLVNLKFNLILSELIILLLFSANFFWKYIGNNVINNFSSEKIDKSYTFKNPSVIHLLNSLKIYLILFNHESISLYLELFKDFDKDHFFGTLLIFKSLIIS